MVRSSGHQVWCQRNCPCWTAVSLLQVEASARIKYAREMAEYFRTHLPAKIMKSTHYLPIVVLTILLTAGCSTNSGTDGNVTPAVPPGIQKSPYASATQEAASQPTATVGPKPTPFVNALVGPSSRFVGDWILLGYSYPTLNEPTKADVYEVVKHGRAELGSTRHPLYSTIVRQGLGERVLQVFGDGSFLITIPNISKDGQPTVVEGKLRQDGRFLVAEYADTISKAARTCRVPIVEDKLLFFGCINRNLVLGRVEDKNGESLGSYLFRDSGDIHGIEWRLIGGDTDSKGKYTLATLTQAQKSLLESRFESLLVEQRRSYGITEPELDKLFSFVLFSDKTVYGKNVFGNLQIFLERPITWEIANSKLRISAPVSTVGHPEFANQTWVIVCDYRRSGKELAMTCTTESGPQSGVWLENALFIFKAK